MEHFKLFLPNSFGSCQDYCEPDQ